VRVVLFPSACSLSRRFIVAKNFESEEDCIIADLNADAPESKPLAQEYGVSSFPTIKFFPKGADQNPIEYDTGRDEAQFTEFLNKHCGTHRAVGGGLNDIVCIVPESIGCIR